MLNFWGLVSIMQLLYFLSGGCRFLCCQQFCCAPPPIAYADSLIEGNALPGQYTLLWTDL
jgi:hypothetical protein